MGKERNRHPSEWPATQRALIALAAKQPGLLQQDAHARHLIGDLAAETLRAHLATLRNKKGVFYSSRPAWVLLRTDYLKLLTDPDFIAHKHSRAMAYLIDQCIIAGPYLQAKFMAHHRGDLAFTKVQSLLQEMRKLRILHEWHGMTLTPLGEHCARQLGLAVVEQYFGAHAPPPLQIGED